MRVLPDVLTMSLQLEEQAGDGSGSAGSGAESVKRRRKGGPRSKTGCLTCRIRRVKCDETKPACTRCSTTGRKCDGYPPPTVETQTPSGGLGSLLGQPGANNPRITDEQTARSLDFFRTSTLDCLAGIWKTRFWTDTLLRAAQADDAVWHALIALGSAHRSFTAGALPDSWALRRNNQALALLKGPNGSLASTETVLTVSLLLTCFEILRRQYAKALTYAKGAIAILVDLDDSAGGTSAMGLPSTSSLSSSSSSVAVAANPIIPLADLRDVYVAFESTVCRVGQPVPYLTLNFYLHNKRPPPLRPSPSTTPANLPGVMKAAAFATVADAHAELQRLWGQTMLMATQIALMTDGDRNSPVPLTQETILAGYYELAERFAAWNAHFAGLLADEAVMLLASRDERRGLELLRMHYLTAMQLMEVALDPGETCWDRFLAEQEELVALAVRYLEGEDEDDGGFGFGFGDFGGFGGGGGGSSDNGSSTAGRAPSLTLDFGVVPVLFYVAWKCRVARVRLGAIALLERHPRVEALWDGVLVAQLCRRIDRIERRFLPPGLSSGLGLDVGGPEGEREGEGESLEEAAARNAGADEIPEEARAVYVGCLWEGVGRSAKVKIMVPGREVGLPFIPIEEEFLW